MTCFSSFTHTATATRGTEDAEYRLWDVPLLSLSLKPEKRCRRELYIHSANITWNQTTEKVVPVSKHCSKSRLIRVTIQENSALFLSTNTSECHTSVSSLSHPPHASVNNFTSFNHYEVHDNATQCLSFKAFSSRTSADDTHTCVMCVLFMRLVTYSL